MYVLPKVAVVVLYTIRRNTKAAIAVKRSDDVAFENLPSTSIGVRSTTLTDGVHRMGLIFLHGKLLSAMSGAPSSLIRTSNTDECASAEQY